MPIPESNMFFGLRSAMTDEQLKFVNSMFDNKVTISNSVAGTGKTTLAVGVAAILQMKLLYIFSPIQESKMGFRPGTQEEKELEYTAPLRCALEKINYNPDQCIFSLDEATDPRFSKNIANQEKHGDIWVYPMSHIFARGINIENRFVVIDECQNFTINELQKILTRIHDNCKVVLLGHTGQCDLTNESTSGFAPYIEYYKTLPYACICPLTYNFRGRISRDADKIHEFLKNKNKS